MHQLTRVATPWCPTVIERLSQVTLSLSYLQGKAKCGDRYLCRLRGPVWVSDIPAWRSMQTLSAHLTRLTDMYQSLLLCPYFAVQVHIFHLSGQTLCDLMDKRSGLDLGGREYSIDPTGFSFSWRHLCKSHLHINLCLRCLCVYVGSGA